MPVARPSAPMRRMSAELLAEARARTVLLVSSLSPKTLTRRPAPSADSILSELQRIVRFEAQVLLGTEEVNPVQSYDDWFDTMMEVRQRVLERLDPGQTDLGDLFPERSCWLVAEHEYQRGEAILEIIQLLGEPYELPQSRPLPRGRRLGDSGFMVRFPGGRVEVGEVSESPMLSEDNPPRRVEVAPFWIDVMPVTNGDFLIFRAAGGYDNQSLWSEDGWRWRERSEARAPAHWTWRDGAWQETWLGRSKPLDFTAPVSQICFFEAQAFARFVEKRLPTEIEWETAAGWDAEAQAALPYPWGHMAPTPHVANLDQLALRPAAVGAFPGNVSPLGCYGMIGDVWEWTGSGFLRGGSWATRPGAIRVSVRRPAPPSARHMFAGFRCARDS